MDGTQLLIGDLAEQVGMAPSALRYYEKAGLLQAEARTAAGCRLYGWRAPYRVRFIQRAAAGLEAVGDQATGGDATRHARAPDTNNRLMNARPRATRAPRQLTPTNPSRGSHGITTAAVTFFAVNPNRYRR